MEQSTLTHRQSYWLKHYQACLNSGEKFEPYCRQHNLSPTGFATARKQLAMMGVINSKKPNPEKTTGNFVAVKATTATSPVPLPANAELILPNGIKIQIPRPLLDRVLSHLVNGDCYDSTR